ncbi:hypothetical protein PFISCL1PPCAC_25435 [Pristionchus fissidentatus]|uniref:Uncharacterized protein n=1 Tax=Pristionchus fissidentatus TaxID=1538716 RepID=A0AAV5WVA8_9BILA|nr:hypothetical protein PFISCL1PPCAC_25435 [Pristionchus fissidentatus]
MAYYIGNEVEVYNDNTVSASDGHTADGFLDKFDVSPYEKSDDSMKFTEDEEDIKRKKKKKKDAEKAKLAEKTPLLDSKKTSSSSRLSTSNASVAEQNSKKELPKVADKPKESTNGDQKKK